MLSVLFLVSAAQASLVDLNNFYADPTVIVSVDGSTATIGESAIISPVLLSNDPFLGDPEVIFAEIAGTGQRLTFDYDFVEPAGNDDEFGAFVINVTTGLSAGPSFEFFTQSTSSGTVSFDLSSLAGNQLGLQFELSALPGDPGLTSTVEISNVSLTPIPVPGAALLGAAGLVASSLMNRGWRRRDITAKSPA